MDLGNTENLSTEEIRARLKRMRESELTDYIRDTVVRLDSLADRLESLVTPSKGDTGA